jgi:hypothetical protein
MTETSIPQYITGTFPHIQIASANGDSFFYYGPDGKVPEKTFPFATLVTKDEYDTVSNLNRPGVFRLNIGVGKSTYNTLLGELPSAPGESGVVNTGHDFTSLDQLMPHPVYGHMAWVCVLNPGENTTETVKQLLAEAYQTAVSKHTKRNS